MKQRTAGGGAPDEEEQHRKVRTLAPGPGPRGVPPATNTGVCERDTPFAVVLYDMF